MCAEYCRFWGKADDAGLYHPAVFHMLDVAAVAFRWMTRTEIRFPGISGDASPYYPTLALLIALHDIGKFSRPFQAKRPDLWPIALGFQKDELAAPRHDTAGFQLLCRDPAPSLRPILAEMTTATARHMIWRAVCGHHGSPPLKEDNQLDTRVWCKVSKQAAHDFTEDLVALMAAPALPRMASADATALAWFLAGLTVLADWIGSNTDWFPMTPGPMPLCDYWVTALAKADDAISKAGVLPVGPAAECRPDALLPPGSDPTPLQSCVATLDLGPADQATLILIEDQTGAGKTEAALMLAGRLMHEKSARGLFIALPTMATANALYDRLAVLYSRLFEIGGESPSLVLAHGRRSLHERFMGSVSHHATSHDAPVMSDADETATTQCAGWIAADRRRAFLADCGVGTIDQALMAVLPTRHAPLRLFGLCNRVLIIDEIHAYDSYMWEEILRLVEFQARLGGHCIILSATLAKSQRESLMRRFQCAVGAAESGARRTDYPLVTRLSRDDVSETPCEPRKELIRQIGIERLADADAAIEAIARASASGAAIAWIRNTVDDAIAGHAALAGCGIASTLFHARFVMGDRLDIEKAVQRRFGRSSMSDERANVVIGTQVMEQSLDLDFDLMITDLAPIDLMLQRAGRLWRHPERERPAKGARMLVISPEPVTDPPANWLGGLGGTLAVYRDPALLWRSARMIFARPEISLPTDVRNLIETVYGPDAETPDALLARSDKVMGDDHAAASQGRSNTLKWEQGYSIGNGAWTSESRTPTRLSEPSLTVRLAKWEGGKLLPWFDHGPEKLRWPMSEVGLSIKRFGVENWLEPDGEVGKALRELRAGWSRFDQDTKVLVLQRSGGLWLGDGMGKSGVVRPLRYDSNLGLSFLKL